MALLTELERVSKTFRKLAARSADDDEAEKKLKQLLADVCTLIASDPAYPNLPADAVLKADNLLHSMVDAAYGESFEIDFVPSFAQGTGRPLVADSERESLAGSMGAGALSKLLPLLQSFGMAGGRANINDLLRNEPALQGPAPWGKIERPSEFSSPIARFRKRPAGQANTLPAPSPLAQAILHARLSASSTRSVSPIELCLPRGSSCLTLMGAGGYKNRDPVLSFFDLNEEDDEFCKEICTSPGLAGVATHLVVDSERKLAYVADDDRVKSYKYDVKVSFDAVLAKHTLASNNMGPLLLVENGSKILRGGKRGVELWNVDTLPDHGPDGKKKVGKGKFSIEDSWRDEPEDIEKSNGTSAHSTTPLHDDAVQPSVWIQLSGGQLVMAPKDRYSCWIADLESGLRPTTRFLGHGGYITQFSTSPDDHNQFLTACNDGVARLFDIREPLPRVSFDCGSSDEFLQSALYIHVDGLPLVISGGQRSQSVKVWDLRTKSIVYELATGNNSVTSLAWDAPRSTLFAATECEFMDRLGYNHDYRNARIPKTKWNSRQLGEDWAEQDEDEDEDMEDEEEDDDDDDDELGWPERAFHEENAFGYAFDCGQHRILRYKFGVDADPGVLPEYGDAMPGQSDNYF
ncbi:hypothetical protein EIP91_005598 [Steccherinum ochraceum]|uniref:Uncharacterized protein n=1 Tax=Steccherinum ochraceum TaxID=92696 RepID=A0A4R0R708_9APHY|nr:hypothetical protein EIP91_005598 [Steccherinum ochraceum]